MSGDSNPFKAPVARVRDHSEFVIGDFLPDGRRVPAGNGYQWLARGWEMFRSAPGPWICIAVAFMGSMMLVGLIPIVNVAANLLIPVFIGGIGIGCRAIEEGEGIRFEHLFAGFSRPLGGLLLVGLLYLLALLALIALFGIVVAVGAVGAIGSAGAGGAISLMVIASGLLMVLVFVPLAMAVWLAPPLVVFHEMSAFQAVRASFVVSLRNFTPFLVYGLLVLLASVVASLPLLLGWLVLLPVLHASLYACYRDLFFAP